MTTQVPVNMLANSPTNRNRIINGAMVIDQRNVGASVSVVSGSPKFSADRFYCDSFSATAVYSVQQVTDAPAGFVNSIKATTTTSSAVGATEYQYIRKNIEGYNIADMGFGSASAKQFTLSFWVKSSLTGLFGGYFGSQTNLRFQTFSYSINAANTWEYKTITVTGDVLVSGSNWNTTNGVGLQVGFSLACGSTYQVATGSWGSSLALGAPSQTNLTATNAATWQVTGVQLEVGSSATGYEYRQYGQELALCQRYCLVDSNLNSSYRWFAQGNAVSSTVFAASRQLPVPMRVIPSITASAQNTFIIDAASGGVTTTAVSDSGFSTPMFARISVNTAGSLVAGQGAALASDGVTSPRTITYSAEL